MASKKRKRAAGEKANSEQPSQKKAKGNEASLDRIIPSRKREKDKLFLDKSPFALELSKDDHERERLLYKLLGSEDVDDRIGAADVIVSVLLAGGWRS